MQTPKPQHRIIPTLIVGHRSDGDVVLLNLAEVSPLFLTYPDKKSWHAFIQSLATSCNHFSDIHWFLYLHQSSLSKWVQTANDRKFTETYIIDDPGTGTFTSRKQFIRAILKANKPHPVLRKKRKPDTYICIIDDIWEFIQKTDRSDARKIADMLRNTLGSSLYIIAGSSPGHRNLFPELLKPQNFERVDVSYGHPVQTEMNRNPTELILGTEGLVFRALPGGQTWEKWYAPLDWQIKTDTGKQQEVSSDDHSTGSISPVSAIEILPENAQVYQLPG